MQLHILDLENVMKGNGNEPRKLIHDRNEALPGPLNSEWLPACLRKRDTPPAANSFAESMLSLVLVLHQYPTHYPGDRVPSLKITCFQPDSTLLCNEK